MNLLISAGAILAPQEYRAYKSVIPKVQDAINNVALDDLGDCLGVNPLLRKGKNLYELVIGTLDDLLKIRKELTRQNYRYPPLKSEVVAICGEISQLISVCMMVRSALEIDIYKDLTGWRKLIADLEAHRITTDTEIATAAIRIGRGVVPAVQNMVKKEAETRSDPTEVRELVNTISVRRDNLIRLRLPVEESSLGFGKLYRLESTTLDEFFDHIFNIDQPTIVDYLWMEWFTNRIVIGENREAAEEMLSVYSQYPVLEPFIYREGNLRDVIGRNQ